MPDDPSTEILSYINPHSILGMVSARYKIFDVGFQKNKNNVVLFYPFKTEDITSRNEDKVFISYLLEDEYNYLKSLDIPHKKSKQALILSDINEEFLKLNGAKFHEFREVRNKYNKICTIKTEPNSLEEVGGLIDVWDEVRGPAHGIQRHSGYDRNFFNNVYPKEKDNLFSYFFYIEDKLVGYSVVSKLGNGINFSYLIRKNDTRFRNLCLYIDYKTFDLMFNELKTSFTINWGAASGKILKYKKKFPIYKEVPVWFCKVIKEKKNV